ncbi:hypothetical protein CAOG_06920 [Capsaspora owczarzaki ATCC 30864]|uniref:SH2 domain-containing protein n=1 Tax=Capsaspora owczarzaki (strain ATCC 30864) TaxID=595528 RepID=A0A0D2UNU8_CAPO3|nr:hypothetical protein CAOG_06920 [Capsaspora owczarzaki ATCC 30864]KJE96621.1 hypothetical protein CAOG_006920 [Capsaspora owczarzaki ATCC 30864]|eukprot:XP_004344541.1 hypothetical protein CAOG_06920 [Capsaspora owczarzaki ATCC 30864]
MSASAIPLSNVSAPDLKRAGCARFGFLRKLTGAMGSWKLRYILVRAGCVYIYKTATASSSQEQYPLVLFDFEGKSEFRKVQHVMRLVPKSPSINPIYLAAASLTDMEAWLKVFRTEAARFVQRPSFVGGAPSTPPARAPAPLTSARSSLSLGGSPAHAPPVPGQGEGSYIYDFDSYDAAHDYHDLEPGAEGDAYIQLEDDDDDDDDVHNGDYVDLESDEEEGGLHPYDDVFDDGQPIGHSYPSHGGHNSPAALPPVSRDNKPRGAPELPARGSGGGGVHTPPPLPGNHPMARPGGVSGRGSAPAVRPPLTCVEDARWFYREISREVAEAKLMTQAAGAFLIRCSETQPGKHVLSVMGYDRVRHYKIFSERNSYSIADDKTFTSELDLLKHYHTSTLPNATDNLRILKGVVS